MFTAHARGSRRPGRLLRGAATAGPRGGCPRGVPSRAEAGPPSRALRPSSAPGQPRENLRPGERAGRRCWGPRYPATSRGAGGGLRPSGPDAQLPPRAGRGARQHGVTSAARHLGGASSPLQSRASLPSPNRSPLPAPPRATAVQSHSATAPAPPLSRPIVGPSRRHRPGRVMEQRFQRIRPSPGEERCDSHQTTRL